MIMRADLIAVRLVCHPQMSHLRLTCCPQSCCDMYILPSIKAVGIWVSISTLLVQQCDLADCVMALLIRPCNRPASSESACLSFLIAFNPVFWRKRRKNHWRKIHSHSEGSSSWLVPQKSHRDRWHLCNWPAKGLWDSSQCNFCSFLSWANWSSCQKIHQTECKRWQFVSSIRFIPSFCTEVDFWRVVLLQNGTHKTLWF